MLVEFRPGEGGDDAVAFCKELVDAASSAVRLAGGWIRHRESGPRIWVFETDQIGVIRPVVGTHRVQRIPKGSAARHTSTASVAIIEAVEANVDLDPKDLKIQAYRGSGAGGQHRNKTDSAIRMTHIPTGIVIHSESQRSQWQNRQEAERELKRRLTEYSEEKLAEEVNSARRQQVLSDRAAKTFTHNEQRSEVVDHSTGKRWQLKKFQKGKW